MPFNFYFQEGNLWTFYIFGFMAIVAIFFNIYMKYWWLKNAEEMKNFKSSLEEEYFFYKSFKLLNLLNLLKLTIYCGHRHNRTADPLFFR